MKLIDKKISLNELEQMSEKMFNELVKAVVDIEKEIMVVDAPLHADQELFLLEEYESEQKNLWGINIHPKQIDTPGWIEFDSMINLRPFLDNKTRGVENPKIRERIVAIVNKLVEK